MKPVKLFDDYLNMHASVHHMSREQYTATYLNEDKVNERYVKSAGYKAAVERIEGLSRQLDPMSRLCKSISKGADNVVPEFKEMEKHMEEIISIWNEIEMMIEMNESTVSEKREDVGKYNTVKKAMKAIKKEYGPTPTVQSVASFINDNYYDVTEVERGDDDPRANDKIADLIATYKFDIEEWEIAWEDAQNESVVTESKNSKEIKELEKLLKSIKSNTPAAQGRKAAIQDDIERLKNESVVTEAVSKATKIYCIATPAPKAMLVGELEDIFGADYRHIVTEFDDDEGYESVLVFNLTPRDIKRIQEEIADVLIWEYSIKKGKEVS